MMTDQGITPKTGSMAIVGMNVEARVIANFAWQHLKAATVFRDQAAAIESANRENQLGPFFEEIRSYVSGSIMASAAALEALINELFIAHGGVLRSQLANFDDEFWGKNGIERKPILEKYQEALRRLNKTELDVNAEPYQSAWCLIEFRNALVHFKPAWDPHRQRVVDLVALLNGRFSLSAYVESQADFLTMRAMTSSCASWTVRTAIELLREFSTRAGLDHGKMKGFWMLEDAAVSQRLFDASLRF